MVNWLLILLEFLTPLCFAFLLLYPFHLRDNNPQHYKGIWLLIGNILVNRYGAIWLLNVCLGINIGNEAWISTHNYLLGSAITIIWISFFGFIFLGYPFYVKHKRPEKYKGLWKAIGEWLGEWRVPPPTK